MKEEELRVVVGEESSCLDEHITACLVKMEKIRHRSVAVFDKLMSHKDFESLLKSENTTSSDEEKIVRIKVSKECQETTKILKDFLLCMVELNFLITTKSVEKTSKILDEQGLEIWVTNYSKAIDKKIHFFDMFQIFLNGYLMDLGNHMLKDWNQVKPDNMTIH